MTDTATTPRLDKPTADMSENELQQALFEWDIQINRAMPIFALATSKERLDSDELEAFSALTEPLTAMRRATPIRYRDGEEIKTRDATDEDVAKYRQHFCRTLWAAGGEPWGYDREADTDLEEDEEDDDDQSMRKEIACEDLQRLIADTTGWIIEITTPSRNSTDGSRWFSWGITVSAVFWGRTFNEALDAAFNSDLLDWTEA